MVISGTGSSWRPGSDGVPQGALLGPVFDSAVIWVRGRWLPAAPSDTGSWGSLCVPLYPCVSLCAGRSRAGPGSAPGPGVAPEPRAGAEPREWNLGDDP